MPKKLKLKVTNKKSIIEKEEDDTSSDEDKEECTSISEPIPNIDNVYLIRRGKTNSYKIGYSNDPKKRLKTFQTGNDKILTIIACCPGGSDIEKQFHNKYSDARGIGEWFRFNSLRILEVIGKYAKLRLQDKENFCINKEEKYGCFNKKGSLNKIIDKPIKVIKLDKDEDEDDICTSKYMEVFVINPTLSDADCYSIPLIEKLHIKAKKYIQAIQTVVLSYYIVTTNKQDFVELESFEELLGNVLPRSEDYDFIKLDKIREIIDMVIVRFNNYSTPGYTDYNKSIELHNKFIDVIAYLKIKEELIIPFNCDLNYYNCVANFNKKYQCSISSVSTDKVKEIVEYIKNNNYFIRVDIPGFNSSAYYLRTFFYNKKLLDLSIDSAIICIMACYLLGCRIHYVNKKRPCICNIGISINPKLLI